MKKKNLKKLTLNSDAISNFSNINGGVAAGDSVLHQLSGCVGDPICPVAHPPKEVSIWSCANQCWTWFTCP